jgi:hypothetical protein
MSPSPAEIRTIIKGLALAIGVAVAYGGRWMGWW